MTLDDLPLFGKCAGIGMLVTGVIAANVTVFRIQKSLNIEAGENISPWKVMGKGSWRYSPVSHYLDRFGSTSLYQAHVIANWFAVIGGVLVLGSVWIGKAA